MQSWAWGQDTTVSERRDSRCPWNSNHSQPSCFRSQLDTSEDFQHPKHAFGDEEGYEVLNSIRMRLLDAPSIPSLMCEKNSHEAPGLIPRRSDPYFGLDYASWYSHREFALPFSSLTIIDIFPVRSGLRLVDQWETRKTAFKISHTVESDPTSAAHSHCGRSTMYLYG